MSIPTVSVILPVYNVAAYLRQCMDSLTGQTLEDIEIICIDDGSTDSSLQILREYEKKDSRIRVLAQPNAGAGAARNSGLEHACGKYLSFLDADDYFDPTMLEEAVRAAEACEAEITVFKARFYDETTGKTLPCTFSLRLSELPSHRPFAAKEIHTSPFRALMGWAWDKLYLRSFVEKHNLRFQEQRTSNDMYFTFISILKAQRITTVDKVLATQRRNSRDSLSVTREKSWHCFYDALTAIRTEIETMSEWEYYEQHFVNYALHACLWNLNSLVPETAVRLGKQLRESWFEDLGIAGREKEYFGNGFEYAQYEELMSAGSDDYGWIRASKLAWELEELRERNKRLQKGNPPQGEAEVQLEQIRHSLSYRLGRVLTWPLRKLRDFCRGRGDC